jgi:hypothetical protein
MTSKPGVTLYNASLYCELCGELIIVSFDPGRRRLIGEHCAYGQDPSQRNRSYSCPNFGKLFAPPAAIEIIDSAASFDGVGTPEQDKKIQEFMS